MCRASAYRAVQVALREGVPGTVAAWRGRYLPRGASWATNCGDSGVNAGAPTSRPSSAGPSPNSPGSRRPVRASPSPIWTVCWPRTGPGPRSVTGSAAWPGAPAPGPGGRNTARRYPTRTTNTSPWRPKRSPSSEWECQVVPGLLQTDEYARAVIEVGADISAPHIIQRRLALRMARQAVLTREPPPRLSVVLDESVLHREIGGRDVSGPAVAASVRREPPAGGRGAGAAVHRRGPRRADRVVRDLRLRTGHPVGGGAQRGPDRGTVPDEARRHPRLSRTRSPTCAVALCRSRPAVRWSLVQGDASG